MEIACAGGDAKEAQVECFEEVALALEKESVWKTACGPPGWFQEVILDVHCDRGC